MEQGNSKKVPFSRYPTLHIFLLAIFPFFRELCILKIKSPQKERERELFCLVNIDKAQVNLFFFYWCHDSHSTLWYQNNTIRVHTYVFANSCTTTLRPEEQQASIYSAGTWPYREAAFTAAHAGDQQFLTFFLSFDSKCCIIMITTFYIENLTRKVDLRVVCFFLK